MTPASADLPCAAILPFRGAGAARRRGQQLLGLILPVELGQEQDTGKNTGY